MASKAGKKRTRKHSAKSGKRNKKKELQNAPSGKHFVLVSGVHLKNIKELIFALDTMQESVFMHHVHDHKNDFATWIREVFSLPEIADDIQVANQRTDLQRALMKSVIDTYL